MILLFREMAPSLLSKKDRGKGHEKERTLPQFGASQVRDRIDGAELLEQAILRGSDGEGSDGDDGGSDGEEGSDDDDDGGGGASGSGSDGEGGSGDEMEVEESDGDDDDEEEEEEEDAAPGRKGVKRARESDAGGADSDGEAAEPAAKRAATEGSLRQLKRAAAASKADELGADAAMPIEQGRFLGPEDFTRIKALKARLLPLQFSQPCETTTMPPRIPSSCGSAAVSSAVHSSDAAPAQPCRVLFRRTRR